jgi:hypothetical protein
MNDYPILTEKPNPQQFNVRDPATGMTYGTLWNAGQSYALEGKVPSAGMASAPMRMKQKNAIEAAGNAQAEAAGTTLPVLRAEYRASGRSLGKQTEIYNMTAAAANSANDFIDLAIQTGSKLQRGQAPKVNRFVNWVRGELTGNPTLSAFEVNIYAAARDYAKVTSGSAASIAGLTDTAQREAGKLINAAQNPQMFLAATEQMKNDMNVIQDNQEKQIASVSRNIANFLKVNNGGRMIQDTGTNAAAIAGPKVVNFDANGNMVP